MRQATMGTRGLMPALRRAVISRSWEALAKVSTVAKSSEMVSRWGKVSNAKNTTIIPAAARSAPWAE